MVNKLKHLDAFKLTLLKGGNFESFFNPPSTSISAFEKGVQPVPTMIT